MSEEKRNKIVAAVTVNAVLLVFIIIAVLIAQIVHISVLKRRKNQLLAELASYSETLDNSVLTFNDLKDHERAYELALSLRDLGVSEEEIMRALLGDDYDKYQAAPVLAVIYE